MDLHRGPADGLDLGIDAEHVADLHGPDEGHRIHRNGDDTALRPVDAGDAAGGVHSRHHPAAEDVAIRVGVGRHRKRADRQLTLRRGRRWGGMNGCVWHKMKSVK